MLLGYIKVPYTPPSPPPGSYTSLWLCSGIALIECPLNQVLAALKWHCYFDDCYSSRLQFCNVGFSCWVETYSNCGLTMGLQHLALTSFWQPERCLRTKAVVWMALFIIASVWLFHDSLVSIETPRHLAFKDVL